MEQKISWRLKVASVFWGVSILFFVGQSEKGSEWRWPAAAAVVLSSVVVWRFG